MHAVLRPYVLKGYIANKKTVIQVRYFRDANLIGSKGWCFILGPKTWP